MVVSAAEASALPEHIVRIVVGPGRLTRSLGIDPKELLPEEYRIKTTGNHLVFAGHDIAASPGAWGSAVPRSPATLYAVCHFLDRRLGVRWLWPGDLGTYVPARKTIVVPPMDVRARPRLELRKLRTPLRYRDLAGKAKLIPDSLAARLSMESNLWKYHHMMGRRSGFRFGHAFRDWWELYGRKHPEFFAVPPPGYKQPYPSPERVKLCVSNPAVARQVISEWTRAGSPDNWNVCPNDDRGFCIGPRCRALDGVPHQDIIDIWYGDGVNLTGRYVTFWNRLLRRMKRINPRATLSTYAYGAYRQPPAKVTLEDGIALEIVDTYGARERWRKWQAAGARLFLRPNWWHVGAGAPHIPLHKMGEFFRFAYEHSMLGFDFDSILGYWAAQGPCYYLIARLSARPDLTVDDVIDEYVSAFGAAAPAIREYLDYWEKYADKCAYPIPAGTPVRQDRKGLYEQACRKHKLPSHPLQGSWRVLPYLYKDDVIDKAFDILNKADELNRQDDETVRARIRFLRDGLVHLRLVRDLVALVYGRRSPGADGRKIIASKMADLQKLRARLTARHVVWGEVANRIERDRNIGIVAPR